MARRASHGEVRLVRVLLDTNVILDVLLERIPFVEDSKQVWKAVDNRQLTGYASATTMTNIYYVVRKAVGADKAITSVRICLATFDICTVDRQVLEMAAALPESDFEDGVQVACALIARLEAIVTRDKTAFRAATIPVFTPQEALQALQAAS